MYCKVTSIYFHHSGEADKKMTSIPNKDISNRYVWIDTARSMACIMVIILHITAKFTEINIGSNQWWVIISLNSFSRFAVPLFFILSGGLLLNSAKSENISYIVNRTIYRLFLPSVICVIIYNILYSLPKIRPEAWLDGLWGGFSPAYHIWFMWPLCALSLATPLLRAIHLYLLKNPCTGYFSFLLWLTYPILGAWIYILSEKQLFIFPLSYIDWTVGYYLLGGLSFLPTRLDHIHLRYWTYAALFSFIMIIYTHIKWGIPKNISLFLDGRSPFVFLLTVSMLYIFKKSKILHYVQYIIPPRQSFGMYLIHVIPISIGSYVINYFFHQTDPIWTCFILFILTIVSGRILFSSYLEKQYQHILQKMYSIIFRQFHKS